MEVVTYKYDLKNRPIESRAHSECNISITIERNTSVLNEVKKPTKTMMHQEYPLN